MSKGEPRGEHCSYSIIITLILIEGTKLETLESNVYYWHHEPKVPNFSQFRQFKYFVKHNNKVYMKVVRKKIRTAFELQQFLCSEKGIIQDVYYSLAMYLDPQRIRGKKRKDSHFKIKDNCFMRMDYGIDIDDKGDIQGLVNYLYNKGYTYIERVETNRGYQVIVKDWDKDFKKIENPRARENYYFQKAINLTFELIKNGFKADWKQSINTRQVFRVVNTRHRRGKVITLMR